MRRSTVLILIGLAYFGFAVTTFLVNREYVYAFFYAIPLALNLYYLITKKYLQ